MCFYIIFSGGDRVDTKRITELLLTWYATHFRALPWRIDATPYHVWISEIMLQQTRIEAVIPYYHRFITALPDVQTLAEVNTESLLKLWEGLGYYSRARNLQKAAQKMVERYAGALPADYDALRSLPGIGDYTAGAIASIAFSIPAPAVDGNVMRVLARLTGDHTDVLSTKGKKNFTDLAWQLIPEQQPGRFNQALMELGETICLPAGTPHCSQCPLNELCVAYRDGLTQQLPVRIKKTKRRIEKHAVAVVVAQTTPPAVLLHKRADSGLLAGMWEFPHTLMNSPLESLPTTVKKLCTEQTVLPNCKHLFSHIEWQMSGSVYYITEPTSLPADYAFATLSELQSQYPLPGAFRSYTELIYKLLNKEI